MSFKITHGLADTGAEESSLEWVKRSRKLQKVKMLTDVEEQERLIAERAEVEAANLRVAHNIEDIQAGTSVILTLKDTKVLNDTRNALNDEEDALENTDLVQQEKRDFKKKHKDIRNLYNAYDDLEGGVSTILPQYDEDNMEFRRKEGFKLDAEGRVSDTSVLEKLKDAYVEAQEGSSYDPWGIVGFKPQSDFLTVDETRLKNLRRREVDKEKEKEKRGKEKEKVTQELAASLSKIEGDVEVKQEPSSSMLISADSQKALQALKAKMAAHSLGRKKAEVNQESIKAVAENTVKKEETALNTWDPLSAEAQPEFLQAVPVKQEEEDIKVDLKKQIDRNRIINTIDDFCTTIEADSDIYERRNVKRQLAEAQLALHREEMGLKDTYLDTDMGDYTEMLEKTEVFKEPKVSTGLLSTMEFIRQKGWIEREFSGRANDRVIDLSHNDPAPEVHIHHLDEYGREMTQKEAFRRVSYAFHSKKPSKRKTEKTMRKMQEENKIKAMKSADTPLNSVAAQKRAQEATKCAYVVLQGGTADLIGGQTNQLQQLSKKEKRKREEQAAGSESTMQRAKVQKTK